MKIIKPGTRPPEAVYRYKCPACGCEGELTEAEYEQPGEAACPMEWCYSMMELIEKANRDESPPRTKADVLADRNRNSGGGGCCNRYADNKACDCMERTV